MLKDKANEYDGSRGSRTVADSYCSFPPSPSCAAVINCDAVVIFAFPPNSPIPPPTSYLPKCETFLPDPPGPRLFVLVANLLSNLLVPVAALTGEILLLPLRRFLGDLRCSQSLQVAYVRRSRGAF